VFKASAMALKKHDLLNLYAQYIKDTLNGKRTKPNGERIRPQTVDNYRYAFGLLTAFSTQYEFPLRIREYQRLSKREKVSEAGYWKKFTLKFTHFLFNDRKVFDNYAGAVFRQVKAFFKYVNNDKLIDTGPYYKQFKVLKEEVPVTALTQEHLIKLIYDKDFEASLPENLKLTKDMFVFGCTVALRFSDLMALAPANFELANGEWYMKSLSKKTKTYVSVKLPAYAVEIMHKYRSSRKKFLFDRISLLNYNKHIKLIGEKMGLTQPVRKARSRRGMVQDVKREGQLPRFCDLMSSHMMRRTAITNMLTLGMPEMLVKHVSGHAGDSKSFHRYVSYSQVYVNTELDKVYDKMQVQQDTAA
jgi:site-specific recombinase XerD